MNFSLFIIAKNENKAIAGCIKSAEKIADEIIIVVNDKQDNTVSGISDYSPVQTNNNEVLMLKKKEEDGNVRTIKVFYHHFLGFTAQKEFALRKCSGKWALNLDADERLTEKLGDEIQQIIENDSEFSGYNIPFSNYFFGKRMEYGGLDQEKHIRLFRTDKAKYVGGLVHEGIEVNGSIGLLQNKIKHYPYRSMSAYFKKFNRYTGMLASQMHAKGRRFNIFAVIVRVPFEFIKKYILRLGFLDGIHGFIWASFASFYVLVKFIKLWDLERKIEIENNKL